MINPTSDDVSTDSEQPQRTNKGVGWVEPAPRPLLLPPGRGPSSNPNASPDSPADERRRRRRSLGYTCIIPGPSFSLRLGNFYQERKKEKKTTYWLDFFLAGCRNPYLTWQCDWDHLSITAPCKQMIFADGARLMTFGCGRHPQKRWRGERETHRDHLL